jgi:proline iminopeptidase
MRAKIRDTEIFFDVDGSALVSESTGMTERPTAFLVHGGPGVDHTHLKAGYPRLAERMQLVYFDHRGQGRSARGDPAKYTIHENVEDMEALRRHLGLGPIVSIGTSYGGVVAMAHAARYPDSVSHLVLCVTICDSRYADLAISRAAEVGTPKQAALCRDLLSGRVDTVEKMQEYFIEMGNLYAFRAIDPVLGEEGMRRAILSPEALNAAHAPGGSLRTFDLRPELPNITAPTLILAGRHDWICPPMFSEEMHRLIPGSDLRIFEQSSHQIASDEPEKFLDTINGFLVYRTRTR